MELILISLQLQRPYFQIKLPQIPGVRTSAYLLEEYNTTHNLVQISLFLHMWNIYKFCLTSIHLPFLDNSIQFSFQELICPSIKSLSKTKYLPPGWVRESPSTGLRDWFRDRPHDPSLANESFHTPSLAGSLRKRDMWILRIT